MSARLLCGDVLEVLATLPERSVRCCVTSPPYWGLRDYGTGEWEGGDADCDHRSPTMQPDRNEDRPKLSGSDATNAAQLLLAHRSACGKCGAVKVDRQLGLEPTPEEYVANMVAVFREVRRVLTDDGTLWLNLGDSYASSGGERTYGSSDNGTGRGPGARRHDVAGSGLKPKDLVGIPWRVAFALQADGWWLRSDIIWNKPNPMPESVTDRPTKAHEYLFLLSKSQRYYYDGDAIAEVAAYPDGMNGRFGTQSPHGQGFTAGRSDGSTDGTRNARTVWTIATKPYPEAHFATFPPELPERCIKAGSAPGDTVLDLFGGSGTTSAVATGLGREAIYIDLNPDYLPMAEHRIGPLLVAP